ncbi:uncharacterized protein EI90DRAFT_3085568 [Cantharellus anzutake]|uniref:uncharacterized protein n=1 Tax=Cantharellus anzutake TaxID=1750568 RepID=UPI0019056CD9|nr:uncharacterized protein EI90DRAFT_3085568 [Cantharellus anzutake]KAF8316987.1 hypothetical protein EI90DRAFT_3085568 [Cantharellus anzutake]
MSMKTGAFSLSWSRNRVPSLSGIISPLLASSFVVVTILWTQNRRKHTRIALFLCDSSHSELCPHHYQRYLMRKSGGTLSRPTIAQRRSIRCEYFLWTELGFLPAARAHCCDFQVSSNSTFHSGDGVYLVIDLHGCHHWLKVTLLGDQGWARRVRRT